MSYHDPLGETRVESQGSATYYSTGQIVGFGAAALGVVTLLAIGGVWAWSGTGKSTASRGRRR